MRDVLIGQTDYTVLVRIAGTDGAPETGLAHTDIDIAYSRVETDNDVTTSDVAPADLASLTAAHSDWGWEEVSSTDHPGLYRLDIADAVFASGAWEAVVTITDASGSDFYAHDIGFRLVAFNAQDGVRLGLTALPNAAADAAGGLPISDAGGLDLDAQIGTKINDILTDTGATLDGKINTIDDFLDTEIAAILAAVDTEIASLITTIGVAGAGLTEAGGDGDHLTAINLPNQTMDIVGNITGNLSGSVGSVTGAVGSVTGAVGSVTGNVGGNVTGSVGSLATQAKADVNAEVLDVLNTDTFAEPGQGAPAATASLAAKIGYLYKNWRNRKTQTSTVWSLYNDDATTVDQKATVSDDGSTATKGEIATGP